MNSNHSDHHCEDDDDDSSSSSNSNGGGEEQKKEKKGLPFWVGDVRFLTLNEKKKLYLGGPDGMFVGGDTEMKAYLAWLRQEQVNRAKCACCGKNEEEMNQHLRLDGKEDKEEKEEKEEEGTSSNSSSKKNKLLRCSRCEITAYCNSHCQKEHWKKHKKVCKKPNNERFNIDFQFGGGGGGDM